MTKQQLERIRRLTNRLSRTTHHDGALTYQVQPASGGALIFCASNIDSGLQWFEKTADLYAIIGPRGGVRKYAGNIEQWEFK